MTSSRTSLLRVAKVMRELVQPWPKTWPPNGQYRHFLWNPDFSHLIVKNFLDALDFCGDLILTGLGRGDVGLASPMESPMTKLPHWLMYFFQCTQDLGRYDSFDDIRRQSFGSMAECQVVTRLPNYRLLSNQETPFCQSLVWASKSKSMTALMTFSSQTFEIRLVSSKFTVQPFYIFISVYK